MKQPPLLRMFIWFACSTTGLVDNLPNIVIFQAEGMDIWDVNLTTSLPFSKSKLEFSHPYIDKVVSEGVVFSRAYVTSPKCAPSRYSLLTGRFPSHNLAIQPLNPSMPAFPGNNAPLGGNDTTYSLQKELQQLGYRTGMMGKYHVNGPCSGDAISNVIECVKQEGWDEVGAYSTSNLQNGQEFQLEVITSESLQFIENSVAEARPFFLHYNPFTPNNFPPNGETVESTMSFDTKDNFQMEGYVLPQMPTVDPPANGCASIGLSGCPGHMKRTDVLARAKATPAFGTDSARATAMLFMDDAIGSIYEKLVELGQIDNTLLLLTTDHAAYSKSYIFEYGIRVPFVVSFKGLHGVPANKQGTVYTGLTSTLDVVPSIFHVLQHEPAPEFHMDGEDFFSKLEGDIQTDSRHVVAEIGFDRAVIGQRYKYVFMGQRGEWRPCAQVGGVCQCSGLVRMGDGGRDSLDVAAWGFPIASSSSLACTLDVFTDRYAPPGSATICQCAENTGLDNDVSQSVGSVWTQFPGFWQWEHLYDLEEEVGGMLEQRNLIAEARSGADAGAQQALQSLLQSLACYTPGAPLLPDTCLVHANVTAASARVQLPACPQVTSTWVPPAPYTEAACRAHPDKASCKAALGCVFISGACSLDPAVGDPCGGMAVASASGGGGITPPPTVPPDVNANPSLGEYIPTNLHVLDPATAPQLAATFPSEVRSQDGSLDVELDVVAARHEGFLSYTSRFYAHAGRAINVGPTLIVRAGDVVNLKVNNKLGPNNPAAPHVMNHFHSPNTTNVHTHGLHVDAAVDSIFVEILPGASHVYRYEIPATHAPGIFWYHSHHHGSSALQVGGGLLGALKVLPRDSSLSPLQTALPDSLNAAPRWLLLLSHIKLDTRGDPNDDKFQDFQMETWSLQYKEQVAQGEIDVNPAFTDPNVTDAYLVNGRYQPVADMETNRFYILELVHAAGGGHALEVEILTQVMGTAAQDSAPCSMHLLASDGVYLPRARVVTRLGLVQAGRLEVAVQCTAAGRFFLQTNGGGSEARGTQVDWAKYTQNLVTLRVAESTSFLSPHTMPSSLMLQGSTDLPAYLEDTLQRSPQQAFEISVDNTDRMPPFFLLGAGTDCYIPCGGAGGCTLPGPPAYKCKHTPFDGQQGDPSAAGFAGSYPHIARMGTLQQVVLNGRTGGNHPMHIHVNHFQIVSYEPPPGKSPSEADPWFSVGDWRDTIPSLPGRITVRFHAADLPGETVFHCHFLRHEDTGMMDTFFITDKDNVTMPPTPDYASNCASDITELLSDPLDVSDYYIAASKAFAWWTGTEDRAAWMPPGKVAVLFGFQFMRYQLPPADKKYILVDKRGREGDLRLVGNAFLEIMTQTQISLLCTSLEQQKAMYHQIHVLRSRIVTYMKDIREKTIATEEAATRVVDLATELYTLDGQVAVSMARAFQAIQVTGAQRQWIADFFEGKVTYDERYNTTLNYKNLCADSFAASQLPSMASEIPPWHLANREWLEYIANGKIANVFGFMTVRDEARSNPMQSSFQGDRSAGSIWLSSLPGAGCDNLQAVQRDAVKPRMAEYRLLHADVAQELQKLRAAPAPANGNDPSSVASTPFDEDAVATKMMRIGQLDGEITALQARAFAVYGAPDPYFMEQMMLARYPPEHFPDRAAFLESYALFSPTTCPALPAPEGSLAAEQAGAGAMVCGGAVPGEWCQFPCAGGLVQDTTMRGRKTCYEWEGVPMWTEEAGEELACIAAQPTSPTQKPSFPPTLPPSTASSPLPTRAPSNAPTPPPTTTKPTNVGDTNNPTAPPTAAPTGQTACLELSKLLCQANEACSWTKPAAACVLLESLGGGSEAEAACNALSSDKTTCTAGEGCQWLKPTCQESSAAVGGGGGGGGGDGKQDDDSSASVAIIAVCVGLLTFAVGTWCYRRHRTRVCPQQEKFPRRTKSKLGLATEMQSTSSQLQDSATAV